MGDFVLKRADGLWAYQLAVVVDAQGNAVAEGTVWVLERASDGARFSVTVSAASAGGVSLAVGTAVSFVACSTGWVISAAGKAIAGAQISFSNADSHGYAFPNRDADEDGDAHDASQRAREVGADRVELYTEAYASAWGTPQQAEVLARYRAAAEAALAVGLGINAGHDLNRDNLADFLREVPGVQEVSIGHALIADALELGYLETIRDYQRCIQRAYAPR